MMIGPGNQVVGVEYERHGAKRFAIATKEVVLCAGAVNTPKILMLSGSKFQVKVFILVQRRTDS